MPRQDTAWLLKECQNIDSSLAFIVGVSACDVNRHNLPQDTSRLAVHLQFSVTSVWLVLSDSAWVVSSLTCIYCWWQPDLLLLSPHYKMSETQRCACVRACVHGFIRIMTCLAGWGVRMTQTCVVQTNISPLSVPASIRADCQGNKVSAWNNEKSRLICTLLASKFIFAFRASALNLLHLGLLRLFYLAYLLSWTLYNQLFKKNHSLIIVNVTQIMFAQRHFNPLHIWFPASLQWTDCSG